ncbi:alpha/beta-hydrolase [Cadophora sp. DSE1049]|nr:alpha/beta-hydrolase [Cadophora sp. DSE1049]
MSTHAPYLYVYLEAAKPDSRIKIPRPVFDPVFAPLLGGPTLPEELDLNLMRGLTTLSGDDGNITYFYSAETIIKDKPHLQHTEYSIPGPDGNEILLSVFSPKKPTAAALPGLYHIHGSGMISGDRFTAITPLIDLLDDVECVIVSVEYRFAPETRAPGPAEDCYAGLVWMSENAALVGVNPAGIIVFGVSGGGTLAAATCLMARDRKCPAMPIKAQMLYTPMLDDRCESLSDQQFEYGNPWCGVSNRMVWVCILGELRGTDKVTPYQSPSRPTDLSNLPPTYIDAGECELYRDPSGKYAMDMWRCGSTCELHVWPGAFHGFDMLDNPSISLIQTAIAAKRSWLKRMMKSGVTSWS